MFRLRRKPSLFPHARPPAANLAVAAHKARGVDSSVFVNQARTKGGHFSFPITDKAAQVNGSMTTPLQRVFPGQAKAADGLGAANTRVDALFRQAPEGGYLLFRAALPGVR